MPEAFDAVPADRFIYRFVRNLDTFLPRNAVTPLPAWFEPTKPDVLAAKARNRPAGWSAFDAQLTTVEQGRALLTLENNPAFGLTLQRFKEIGAAFGRQIGAVYLPMVDKKPMAGWDGHVLVEGLKREDGGEKKKHNDLQLALSTAAVPVGALTKTDATPAL